MRHLFDDFTLIELTTSAFSHSRLRTLFSFLADDLFSGGRTGDKDTEDEDDAQAVAGEGGGGLAPPRAGEGGGQERPGAGAGAPHGVIEGLVIDNFGMGKDSGMAEDVGMAEKHMSMQSKLAAGAQQAVVVTAEDLRAMGAMDTLHFVAGRRSSFFISIMSSRHLSEVE